MRSARFLTLFVTLGAIAFGAVSSLANSGQILNLPATDAGNVVFDDTVPDVTARVARISFIRGDVQIKRVDSQEWEKATLNLPVVEGDEITTAGESRLEIQFNRNTHLRLDENSYLKISRLSDAGIAVSLPQGLSSVRVRQFDIDKTYFEIDAPGSTVAVQRAGTYRIDAGKQGDTEVRVSVSEGGEARIYSESSGFTLKNGRSARVFVTGSNAGEWETGDVARFTNDFDDWALERDSVISRALQNAYYDRYYDQDIYGAEDLDGYGEWVYTRSYGYVWRPYRNATSSYANWSPYRYGHWRWVPPYGWTWINDEPWGWATYHHGRWLYDNGYWVWSPYGYYRSSRSWWSPALVVITTWGGNVCWFPLPYNYGYYNYNWWYHSQSGWNGGHWGGNGGNNGGNGGGHNGGNNGGGGPTPTPTPGGVVAAGPLMTPKGPKMPPLGTVPPSGVVTVAADEFGKNIKGTRMPPLSVANSVLSKVPDERTGIKLPSYKDIRPAVSTEIRTERPKIAIVDSPMKTGAMVRKADGPLDGELRTTRVFGGRPPTPTLTDPIRVSNGQPDTTRKTGAVERPPVVRSETPTDTRSPRKLSDDRANEPVRPTYVPPQKQQEPDPVRQPRYDPPPTRSETPKYDPPPRQETPRSEPVKPPPPRQETPRSEPVKPPPPRNDPPKSDPKPDKPAPMERKKDGTR